MNTVDHGHCETLSVHWARQLQGVAAIRQIELDNEQGNEVFILEIIDKQQWKSPEKRRTILLPLARILWQTFQPGENLSAISEQRLLDECKTDDTMDADRIIVSCHGQQVMGFVMMKHAEPMDGGRLTTAILTLLSVEAETKATGFAPQLWQHLLEQCPGAAILSCTHTPAVIISGARVMDAAGYRWYFVGCRNGDERISLSRREIALLDEGERVYHDAINADGGILDHVPQSKIPRTIDYGTGSILWGPEHQWNSDKPSPVGDAFTGLRARVFAEGMADHGVFGYLIFLPLGSWEEPIGGG